MKIIAIDDEPLAREMLVEAITEATEGDAEITAFAKPSALLTYARDHQVEIAFLDISMRGMTGVDLAKAMKALIPAVNIIFVTGYDDYTGDAMALHASGYIMKPVTADKVKKNWPIFGIRFPRQNRRY
mgnify:CR=1 FL=1